MPVSATGTTVTATATAAATPVSASASASAVSAPATATVTAIASAGSNKSRLRSNQPDQVSAEVNLVRADASANAIPSPKTRPAPDPSAATRSARTTTNTSTSGSNSNSTASSHSHSSTIIAKHSPSRDAVSVPAAEHSDHRRISRRLQFLARHPIDGFPTASQTLRLPPLRLSRSSSSQFGLRRATDAAAASTARDSSKPGDVAASPLAVGDTPSNTRSESGATSSSHASPTDTFSQQQQQHRSQTSTSTSTSKPSSRSDGSNTESSDEKAAETSLTSAKVDNAKSRVQLQRGPSERDRKMHQTSSRLLRMTDEERPFSRVSEFTFLFGVAPDEVSPTLCASASQLLRTQTQTHAQQENTYLG